MNAPGSAPDAVRTEREFSDYHEAHVKRRRLLPLLARTAFGLSGMVTATAAAVGVTAYQTDINENMAALANTKPYVLENAPLPYNRDYSEWLPHGVYESLDPVERRAYEARRHLGGMAVVTFSGVGRTMIPDGGKVFSPFNRYAENLSIVYDRAGIDTTVMARTLLEHSRDEGRMVDSFAIYGNSAGASIGTDVAVKLAEMDNSVKIPALILDSGAIDISVVRPKSRSEGLMMNQGLKFPGMKYSRYGQIVGEVVMNGNQIHDIPSFLDVVGKARSDVMDNPHVPGSSLYADQFAAIQNSEVRQDLMKLGKLAPERRPEVFCIKAADPARDDVIDAARSCSLLKKWTGQAGLALADPISIKNLYHGEPAWSMKQYHKAFKNEIIPALISPSDSR